MDYKPLRAYGIIGNLETAVLVGRDGAIDWCCLPHVESSSVFARILDSDRGGHFTVQPAVAFESVQEYTGRTNVLRTRFKTASGTATVTDFMPVPGVAAEHRTTNQAIYRHVTCEEGAVDLQIGFEPRFDYGLSVPTIQPAEHGVAAAGEGETMFLTSSISLDVGDDDASAATELEAGEDHWLVLSFEREIPILSADHEALREDVGQYWRKWAHDCRDGGDCPLAGEWHDLALRSTLVLKPMTHAATGAICAAPTISLSEDVGGVRNWDYRYNWIRDAAFTVRALAELGHIEEAGDYFDMCMAYCGRGPPSEITPVYGLHGEDELTEQTLDHLVGYRGSAPVRVGNIASEQHQLDVYGELVQGVYGTALSGNGISEDDWAVLYDVVDYVCEKWRDPDVGFWEMRTERRHFVYSKVMCWVAIDRCIKIVEETDYDGPVERWLEERQAIRDTVLDQGYSETADSFVQSFGEKDTLDATALLIPLVGFLPVDDERVQSTIDTIVAMAQFLRRRTNDGVSLWHAFWMGGHLSEDDAGVPEGTRLDRDRPAGMFWGISLPWYLIGAMAFGFWLMLSPSVFGIQGLIADSSHLTGALVVSFAVIATAGTGPSHPVHQRPTGALGNRRTLAARWRTDDSDVDGVLVGALLVVSNVPKGTIRDRYGFWQPYTSDETLHHTYHEQHTIGDVRTGRPDRIDRADRFG